ncbi:MAG: hypothetical protein BKP49_03275 [Treponema sp. CETP13]|nr:MAG: hypothetical protein BKP49_03275 [Treponema sp. CETP13]
MTLIVSFFVGCFLLVSCSFDSNSSDVTIIDDSEAIANLFSDYIGNTYSTTAGDSLTLSEKDSAVYYEYKYSYTYENIDYSGTTTSGYIVAYAKDSNTDGDTVYMGLIEADYHENAYAYSYPSYTQETYTSEDDNDRDCYVPVMFEFVSSVEIKFSEYCKTFDNGSLVTCFDSELYGLAYLPYDMGTYTYSSDATLDDN